MVMEMGSRQRCGKWLPSKRRLCASWALPSQQFCGNHQESDTQLRVACPLDPSHTILQAEVEAHVKRCNVAKQQQRFDDQEYFRKGVNAGSDDEGQLVTAGGKRAAVAELSKDAFGELVRRIKAAFDTHCQESLEESISAPEVCNRWAERDRRLPFQEKHVVQQASILGNLEDFGLLETSGRTCYVEFGAGRGYLSHMLCDCYGVGKVVMIERRSYKFKADRTLRQQAGVSLDRLRIDIEDLKLGGVPSLLGLRYVAVSKHLCGPATDLTLRCCLSRDAETFGEIASDDVKQVSVPVLFGVGIATCCHHLCSWKSFVNKRFFLELGFTKDEFCMITWLSSWAVSGDAEHGEGGLQQDCPLSNAKPSVHLANGKHKISEAITSLSADERKELGMRCKRLIDTGRLRWLNQQGMRSKLVKYVPETISPENTLLLAIRV